MYLPSAQVKVPGLLTSLLLLLSFLTNKSGEQQETPNNTAQDVAISQETSWGELYQDQQSLSLELATH